jgi:hypothetical protein
MASSASGEAVARERGAALALARVGDLRPYLLLALLTVVALTLAYGARPVVRIQMGGDYDAAFLQGFNGREIDAAGAAEAHAWPAGQETLTLPGRRRGVWIATLRLAPGKPAGILDEAAIAVNGERVDMPRRTSDTVLAKIPPELAAAETLSFSLVSPLVGGALPPRDIVGEVVLAPARTYRWSTGESSVALPNLGRGAWAAELAVVTAHPDGQPVEAQLYAGERLLAALPDSPAPRRLHLLVPPDAVRDGSLELTLRANTYADPRPLGVLLSAVTVAPLAGAGLAAALPPLGGLAMALVTVLGAFAALSFAVGSGRWGVGSEERRGGLSAAGWAALGVAAAALLGAWALGAHRFPSSFMLPRLAWLAVASVLLVLALRPLTRWLFRAAGAPIDNDGRADHALTPRASRPHASRLTPHASPFLSVLLVLFLVSFWLKAAGALFPYFVAIDVEWHMTRARWILDGQLPLLYGTNSPLNESTMPTAEWGENRPVIPYSPWFHIFATLFAFSPISMETTANMFSILLDSTRVILIALIALKAGLSRRAALLAAATFAALPVAFLLHSWGNIPTAMGLWLTLVCNTVILCFWERLHERRVMVTLSALLLATFLEYTVTGVFMGVYLVVFTAIVWLNGRRGGAWRANARPLGSLWLAAGVAIAMALLIYYGQYIWLIIQQTVPYMSTVFTQGPESVGVERPPFGQYLWAYVPHLDYRIWPGDYLYFGLLIPVLFTLPGFFALRHRPLIWTLFAAWGTVALLFLLAGYRISMVDKQLFYLLPMICVCWAIYAERLWARGRWGRLVVVTILLYTLVTALDQWALRIATSPVVG